MGDTQWKAGDIAVTTEASSGEEVVVIVDECADWGHAS